MAKTNSDQHNQTAGNIFSGTSEMNERMRALDWSQTPLGAVENWQQSLKTAVRLMLNSRFSMFIWWGEELVYLYNDAYLPTLGIHHPEALGRPAPQVWSEIWRDVEPQVKLVTERGEATWNEELLLFLERRGFKEETYHTFSYSPIIDDHDRIGGLFCAVSEDTQKVLNRRRLQTLRDLSERTTAEVKTVHEACRTAAEVLGENPFDLPFAAIYLLDADGKQARLSETVRIDLDRASAAPPVIEIDPTADIWEFQHVLSDQRGRRIENIEERFGRLSAGAWDDDHAREAFIVPLAKTGTSDLPAGFLVAGISPRLVFDKDYQGFLELVAGQIATSLANVEALEAERKRAEALAEIDRAKTEFFSNVSHEFRTPLTLMLGNLEEVLGKDETLPENEREQIETAHRNSLRLLKLVNNLLDFSRIEAGKAAAHFEATDLARLTAELASGFRAGIEKVGIKLKVDCPPLSTPVAVDRDMWEKIVLNLLSNAFKFTLSGEIEVALDETAGAVKLTVRDSGVGIPADELPNIFERFHRVRSVQGRTHEGTGIGLSLVQELVKLHHGTIEAQSEIGAGTVFTVTIPKIDKSAAEKSKEVETLDVLPGFAVKPPARLPSYLLDSSDEKSFDPADVAADESLLPFHPTANVLLADDNADMRAYISRLLRQNGYAVQTVEDGQAALEKLLAAAALPNLILTDVMMPRLDGFELIAEIRRNERTREIPVIMLSARAGEEAKIEGFEAGADDYLIKPFSARELLARVDSVIELSKMRREIEAERKRFDENLRQSQAHLQLTTEAAQIGTWEWHIAPNEIIWSPIHKKLWGFEPTPDPIAIEDWARLILASDLPPAQEAIEKCLRREGDYDIEYRITPVGGGEIRWIRSTGKAVFDDRGEAVTMLGVSFDITEQKQAEELLQKSEAEFRELANAVPQIVWVSDHEGIPVFVNQQWTEFTGLDTEQTGQPGKVRDIIHPDDRKTVFGKWNRAIETGTIFEVEGRMKNRQTGAYLWFLMRSVPTRDAAGKAVKWFGTLTDITTGKSAENRAVLVAEINQLTRQFENPASLLYVVSKVLGEYFQVRRCLFNEIFLENDLEVVHRDYCDGVEPVAGKHKISDYSAATTAEMIDGRTVVNRDSKIDPRTAGLYEQTYAPSGERAYVAVPLLRENQWVASLWISDDEPRDWSKDDINLLEIVAEQVWSVVEKLRIDAALRESEKRFRNMADHAPVMVWMTDPTGFCTYLSQSWYEFTGQTPETGLGFGWIDATHPSDAQRAEEEFVNSNRKQSPFQVEYRLRRKDGEYRWAIDSAQPRFGDDGEYLGYIGSVIDITERKAAEQEREKLLAQEKILREEAENANRLKDEFLATVSHELRTPLNSMLGWATMVRQSNYETDLMRRAFEIFERNARNQNQIISDILDVSRIITGKLNLNLQPVHLSKAILAAVDTVRPAIDAKDIDLKTVFELDTGTVIGDFDRLQQIVWNLLSNAVKFTPQNGTIEIALNFTNDSAEIAVTDNGSGIEPEFLPFVFDRFRQADGKMNRRYGGLGLGLAIARHLTELHGGAITAESRGGGQGATFRIRFPLKSRPAGSGKDVDGNFESDAQAISRFDRSPQNRLEGLKILVIDDEPDALELVAFILSEENAAISAADSVDAALKLYETENFDALISDIGMPEKDGFQLMREIKARTDGQNPRFPTIALTAYAREEDSRQVLDAGFTAYLPKPVEPAKLIETLIEITRRDGD